MFRRSTTLAVTNARSLQKRALYFVQLLCSSAGSSQTLGRVSHMKLPTFEKRVTQFLQLTVRYLHDQFVTKVVEIYTQWNM